VYTAAVQPISVAFSDRAGLTQAGLLIGWEHDQAWVFWRLTEHAAQVEWFQARTLQVHQQHDERVESRGSVAG